MATGQTHPLGVIEKKTLLYLEIFIGRFTIQCRVTDLCGEFLNHSFFLLHGFLMKSRDWGWGDGGGETVPLLYSSVVGRFMICCAAWRAEGRSCSGSPSATRSPGNYSTSSPPVLPPSRLIPYQIPNQCCWSESVGSALFWPAGSGVEEINILIFYNFKRISKVIQHSQTLWSSTHVNIHLISVLSKFERI